MKIEIDHEELAALRADKAIVDWVIRYGESKNMVFGIGEPTYCFQVNKTRDNVVTQETHYFDDYRKMMAAQMALKPI